jgi:4-hydroxythreonine-4-phosphate dehydrogenase
MAKPFIAITIGDPAGIGPEICEKALLNPEIKSLAHYVVIGDRNSIPPRLIGRVSAAAGKASIEYVEKAIDLASRGEVDAIVTCPISKEAIHKAGYKYQGHTEILAKKTKSKNYAMLFVAKPFWVMLVTIHIPLKEVSRQLKKSEVLRIIKLAQATLIKAGVKQPRIGVAGLNPHAGENGILGKEESTIIAPAVATAKKAGINVTGPISPDAIFNQAKDGKFDLVVAMYHDQGLIPIKLLAFGKAVNVTAGLPFVRTSVDHGTGFDIAGKGLANPGSLIQAIKVAVSLA